MNTRCFLPVLLLALAVTAPGCGGIVGTDTRPAPDPGAPSATSALSFSEEELDSSLETCASPHGSVQTYRTVDELVALLGGHWAYCPGGEPLPSRGQGARLGVEFTSDGHVYWLARGEPSTISRGTGIEGAAAYEITPPMDVEVNDVSFQIDIIYPDRSVMGTYATFEVGPRRLKLLGYDGYFVPLKRSTP